MITSAEVEHELLGRKGAEAYRHALMACHEFAQASSAPPGVDVFRWMIEQHEKLVFAHAAKVRDYARPA